MEKQQRSELTQLATDISNALMLEEIRVRTHYSKDNSSMIHTAVFLWIHLIEDTRNQTNLKSLKARLQNFVKFVAKHDFNDVIECYSHASDLIISDKCCDYADFKHQLTLNVGFSPELVLSPVNEPIVDWYRDRDVADLKGALTLLRFMRKLPLDVPSLKADALKKYLEDEQSLATLCLPAEDVAELECIIRFWLKDFKPEQLIPHHGPGNVAEKTRSKEKKFDLLCIDRKLSSALGSLCHFNIDEKVKYVPNRNIGVIDRCSRLAFVPKTSKSLRAISLEPASLQYFQQGVKDNLYDYISHHHLLKKRIHIEDQSFNQDWARLGSFTGELATIDLSSASDLVSFELVKSLFVKTPLYKWLLATRSSQTLLPSKERITLRKFAPMGSALCFPIESLIFAACCELVKKRNLKQWKSYDGYLVFGDDMVVPTIVVDDLITLLISLGFRVNTQKSYWSGPYRESCGKEYWEGYDVSPIFCRVASLATPAFRPKVFMQLCDLANYALERGFPELRRASILILHNTFDRAHYPMFSQRTNVSPSITSQTATNFRLIKKWSKDYQSYVYKVGTVVGEPDEIISSEEYRYFDSLLHMAGRNTYGKGHMDIIRPVQTLSTQTTILRSVWKTPS